MPNNIAPSIPALTGTEEFQITGLSAQEKTAIKLDAVKRDKPASAVMVAAWKEFVKRYPA